MATVAVDVQLMYACKEVEDRVEVEGIEVPRSSLSRSTRWLMLHTSGRRLLSGSSSHVVVEACMHED